MELVKKKPIFILSVVVLSLVISVETQNVNLSKLDGCSYAISNTRNETFLMAAEECQRIQMTLVFITTEDEANYFVTQLNTTADNTAYWIGARRSAGSSTYQWGDYSAVNEYPLIKWKSQTKDKDCVLLTRAENQFYFMDSACKEMNGFICSKCDVNALPWRLTDMIIVFAVAGVVAILVIVTISMAIVASMRKDQSSMKKSEETIVIDNISHARSSVQPTALENSYKSMEEIDINAGVAVVDDDSSDDEWD